MLRFDYYDKDPEPAWLRYFLLAALLLLVLWGSSQFGGTP